MILTPQNTALCSVSRLSRKSFVEDSLLGRSLRSVPRERLPGIRLLVDNGPPNAVTGLAQAYNNFLDQAVEQDVLIFIHDDVFVHDWFLLERLTEAFLHYDVVGVAGNRHPELAEPSWALRFNPDLSPAGWQDAAHLSGAVGHGEPSAASVTFYGPTPAPCVLLDGLFLAVNVKRLRQAKVAFDPRFNFHCYDLDFCRTANQAGLRLGTWPLALTHASGGSFAGLAWKEAAVVYLSKWKA